jgi:tetratricopeptide (TPR) repeat protein
MSEGRSNFWGLDCPPYNPDMRTKRVGVLSWLLLGFGLQTAASQANPGYPQPSHQQQIEEHSRRAAEDLKANKPELAVPEFKAILAIDPKNVDAHGNLGAILYFQGAYAEAVPQLRAAVKLRPTLWKTQALLGIGEKRTGDIETARVDLEKAFANLTDEKVRIDAGMELIEIESNAGDLDKAAATVGVLRRLDPTNSAILYTAYRLYSDLADDSLLSLSVVDPNAARFRQALAHELAKRGNTAEAIENYRAALKLDPQLLGLHFELAEMLSTLGTPEGRQEAESEYRAALVANPRDGQAESRLGEIAFKANDLQAASGHYARAVQLQPNDADANIGLAKVLMATGETQKAEALLHHAVELDPTNAVAHFRLSTIYRQSGRTAEAKVEIEKYQKYNKMKEKLREVYHDLHRDQIRDESDEPNLKK